MSLEPLFIWLLVTGTNTHTHTHTERHTDTLKTLPALADTTGNQYKAEYSMLTCCKSEWCYPDGPRPADLL